MNTEQRLHDITEMLLLVRDNLFHGMSKSIQKLQARSINEVLDVPNFMTNYKDPLIEAAVLAEREACAKVCEDACAKTGVELVGKGFAAAIRARGEK